jgi:hypothetical protein
LLPGADFLKKHSILLASPLILASLLKVVNLIPEAVLLIVHVSSAPVLIVHVLGKLAKAPFTLCQFPAENTNFSGESLSSLIARRLKLSDAEFYLVPSPLKPRSALIAA